MTFRNFLEDHWTTFLSPETLMRLKQLKIPTKNPEATVRLLQQAPLTQDDMRIWKDVADAKELAFRTVGGYQ